MIEIHNYRGENLPAQVTLINEADAFDKLARATTLQEMEHEMSFPTYHPETDCFLVWEGNRLVGYTDLFVAKGDADTGSTIYNSGVVHPQWRRRGLGQRLLRRPTTGPQSAWPRSNRARSTSTAEPVMWKRTGKPSLQASA